MAHHRNQSKQKQALMNKRIFETLFICLLSCLGATAAPAQAERPQSKLDNPSGNRSDLNESFELNISDRLITKKAYAAQTAVELGSASESDLRLNVGVAVRADTINVRLRNVRGNVHFRGSLQRMRLLLNSRPPTNPPTENP
jgi:hypothetical protein